MIENTEQLREFAKALNAAPWISLDTEADSLHAYPEKVCLIQISIPGKDVLVDPLALNDLSYLWRAIQGKQLTFHAADYDLRLLYRAYRFVPTSIFDTMLAARLLGYESIGLGDLVFRHFSIKLEKGPQKADWSKRPLSQRMETYARNDSHYLNGLEAIMSRELVAKDRLSWHQEMCSRLVAVSTRDEANDPDLVWRIKGSHRLDRRSLAILRAIWQWRETEAVASNTPPFFILSPEAMTGMSEAAAAQDTFEHLLPRRFSSRRREGVMNAVHEALSLPQIKCPHMLPKPPVLRLNGEQKHRLLGLEEKRNKHAAALKIDPSLIASRAMLISLAAGADEARNSLMNWQRHLLFEGD